MDGRRTKWVKRSDGTWHDPDAVEGRDEAVGVDDVVALHRELQKCETVTEFLERV